jgi:cytochrome b561
VVIQFLLGVTWGYFREPMIGGMQMLHISLGVLLTVVIVARIAWRVIPRHQRAAIVSGWVKLASKGVHYLLYLLLIVQAGLGFSWRWARGHAASFFPLLQFLAPTGMSRARRVI